MEPDLSFEFELESVQNTERVKSVDLHPTKPWVLLGWYSGTILRSAKFIDRENWIVAAADDKYIRIFDYEKMEKMVEVVEHKDYVRSLAVHPFLPYVVSASGSSTKTVELEKSASLYGTLKIWNLDSSAPKFTLEGHQKGVNCVDYFISNDKQYLLSGSDDYTVKVWDCHSRNCVQTLEGHGNNVTAICALPELPIFITASEDSTVKIWDAATYLATASLLLAVTKEESNKPTSGGQKTSTYAGLHCHESFDSIFRQSKERIQGEYQIQWHFGNLTKLVSISTALLMGNNA
ncbi:hypothetical protein VNO78_14473 [Psophocarpus tetragonolobus]|uniref:Uncharacterized protein n=1 Tax=Psophocarpus tetragonolobus TaxID=3891 RepID=A0AAN9XQ26_PSOTE